MYIYVHIYTRIQTHTQYVIIIQDPMAFFIVAYMVKISLTYCIEIQDTNFHCVGLIRIFIFHLK